MASTFCPLNRIIPIPPGPTGVAIAAISSSKFLAILVDLHPFDERDFNQVEIKNKDYYTKWEEPEETDN
jgi:hypothetical protein